MFLTKTKDLFSAHREASQRVARATRYSVDLPIVGRVMVPPPEQLAIYAALGGLAVLELIDWPVAVAMGVGSTLVARHLADLEAREEELAQTVQAETIESGAAAPAMVAATPAKNAQAKKAPARKAPARKAGATKAPAKKAVKKAVRKTGAKAAPRKAPPAG